MMWETRSIFPYRKNRFGICNIAWRIFAKILANYNYEIAIDQEDPKE